MRTMLLAIVVAAILTVIANTNTSGYTWLSAMFSDNVVVAELYEDGSGMALDREGHKITFCVENMPCDNSTELFLPAINKGE